MFRNSILSLFLIAISISVVGCGPDNSATFDQDAQPVVTEEEKKASEDYAAKMKAEHEAMYGK
jgi:hypothetical protein